MWERGAGLAHADLSGANLKGANATEEQLAECASLEGTIVPDGTKHPRQQRIVGRNLCPRELILRPLAPRVSLGEATK